MTSVQVYDGYYTLDPLNDWDNLSAALIKHTYTFNHTHASVATNLAPNETTGSGYARLTGVQLLRASSSGNVENYKMGTVTIFAVMTTTDYRYVLLFNGDVPILLIDTAATNTLTGEALTIAGTLFTVTGP